uniref:PB1-like domain-containing protein n=1 Tax=Chenopodium quinoa TaxID=63459 RepID=A0A803LCE1_CHEQI
MMKGNFIWFLIPINIAQSKGMVIKVLWSSVHDKFFAFPMVELKEKGEFYYPKILAWGTYKIIRNGELVYSGGEGRIFSVDPDELCYFDFIGMAKSCGQYKGIDGLFYLVPGMYLVDGIRKIGGDAEVIEMG